MQTATHDTPAGTPVEVDIHRIDLEGNRLKVAYTLHGKLNTLASTGDRRSVSVIAYTYPGGKHVPQSGGVVSYPLDRIRIVR